MTMPKEAKPRKWLVPIKPIAFAKAVRLDALHEFGEAKVHLLFGFRFILAAGEVVTFELCSCFSWKL